MKTNMKVAGWKVSKIDVRPSRVHHGFVVTYSHNRKMIASLSIQCSDKQKVLAAAKRGVNALYSIDERLAGKSR